MSGEDVKVYAGHASGTGTAYDAETEVSHRSRGPKYAGPAEEVRRVVIVPVPPEPAAPAWSPPGVPDFAGAYRECIAGLVRDHAPLTWESLAVRLQDTYDTPRRKRPGTNEYADLHAKTVAGWAERAGLPHPREFRGR